MSEKLIQLLNMRTYPKGIFCPFNKFGSVVIKLSKRSSRKLSLLYPIIK